MTETERQSKEIIASMFLRLSRGETVTKEEATKARDNYNAFVMELETYKYIKDLDNSSGTNLPSPESVREENKKLQRELDDLKKSNDMLNKELEIYKRKSEHSMSKRLEKGCNTDNTGQECAKPGHRLERFRNGNRDEELRYVRNKEEVENVCEKIKKLQRELESLKKSNDILNKEYEYYKRLSENNMSKRIEKGCNTDNSGEEWSSQVHKLEELKQKKLDEGLRYFKNREKGGQEAESTAMEKLRQRNQQLTEEKEKLNDQIKELRDRLSVIAGHKLTAGNPDIADLSDAFRPTKVAEEFGQLYDNEWTSAFDELQKFTDNEVNLTDILAMIVKDLDSFCSRAQQQQLDRLKNHALGEMLEPESHTDGHGPTFQKSVRAEDVSQSQKNHANRLLKDFRKSFGILSVPWLRKSFNKGYMSPFVWERKEVPRSKCLKDFAEKALGLVWVMKIQDPPMELTWCKRGDTFNKNMYNYYTNRGNTVKHCVWPAVLLHKDGPLMSKGVAQGM